MELYSISDIGLARSSNQDAERNGILPGGAVWMVVCDGMGGVNGGNIASSVAVEAISQQIQESYREDITDGLIKNILIAAIYNANASVYDMAGKDPQLAGMGTTVVATIVRGDQAYIAHAGDSRAYLLEGGGIRQLTTDHSMVQELVNIGDLTEQEAKNHPQKNIITRAVGVEPAIEIDYIICGFAPGSQLLLCTDGLTNYVEPDQIQQLASQAGPKELCEKLVELAKTGGGGDNITVALVKNTYGQE